MLNQSTSLQVPFLNFTTLSFAAPLLSSGRMQADNNNFAMFYPWNGPSQVVERITAAVTAQGVILPLTAPSPNSSWHLEFWGPSLKCENVDDARRQRIGSNIAEYYSQDGTCNTGRDIYLSWFQDPPYTLRNGTDYGISQSDLSSEAGSNATITIAVFPGMLSRNATCDIFSPETSSMGTNQSSTNSTDPLGNVGEGSSMIQCKLFNSTYEADFVYLDGEQSIAVNAPVKSSDEPLTAFDWVGQLYSSDNTLSECFGFNMYNATYLSLPEPCDFDPAILRVIAYQAVMDAFTSVLRGTVTDSDVSGIVRNGSILSTTLVDTKELAFLNDQTTGYLSGGDKDGPDLGSALAKLGKMDVSGLPQADRPASNRSLSDALEEMFRNLTISLMSSDLLR